MTGAGAFSALDKACGPSLTLSKELLYTLWDHGTTVVHWIGHRAIIKITVLSHVP